MISRSSLPATADDIVKLMTLLQEYTQKLRAMCEAKMSAQFRRAQSVMVLSVSFCFFMIAALWLFGEKNPFINPAGSVDSAFHLLMIAALGVCVIVVVAQFLLGPRGHSTTSDVEQVAATVERLVKLASQYAEHSQLRIGDRFEYELRLAEAEGALKTFHRIFRVHVPENKSP
jgi:hypothetical protein